LKEAVAVVCGEELRRMRPSLIDDVGDGVCVRNAASPCPVGDGDLRVGDATTSRVLERRRSEEALGLAAAAAAAAAEETTSAPPGVLGV
jgi:hypothetical protein